MVMLIMEIGITSKIKNEAVYYFVNWSCLSKAERYDIIYKVPEVAGVYEIYWMDENKHLRLFIVGKTDYSGLRTEIRNITDPELCYNDKKAKKILEEKEIWYRYSTTNSSMSMDDVIWFFMNEYFPEKTDVRHSGRYKDIFLKESTPDKLLWVE